MERKFVSDINQGLDTLKETSAYFRPLWIKVLMVVFTALISAVMLGYAMTEPELLKWYCGAGLIGAFIAGIPNRDGGSAYRKLLAQNGGVPRRNLVYITEEGIRYWNPETDNRVEVAFSEVKDIQKTKHFLVLMADKGPYLINHANLTGGTAEELEQFLMERCGVGRITQKHSVDVCRRIMLCVLIAGFCWSFFGVYRGVAPQPRVMTHREAAAILEELGIDAPEEAELQELEQYGAGEGAILDVLYYAGDGEYDFETWEWTPAESGVYTFDVEVFDVGAMYTNFLRGVEGASRGALQFGEIIEDDSGIDFENGTGYKTVTFFYNGVEHTFRPTVMNDWFDVDFANDLAKLVGKAEDGRQLYFLYDGYQMVSIFYCDAGWAREFAKAAGYSLSTRFQ